MERGFNIYGTCRPDTDYMTYDFRKEKNRASKAKWVEWDGLRIFDVII